jgi:hypothetical protein
MKRLLAVLSVVVVLLCCWTSLQAQEGPYLLVRVTVTPEVKLIPLLELGLDITGGVKDQYLEVVCHPAELAQIRALGYTADVLIEDMERYYAEQAPVSDDMGGFHTYSETVQLLNAAHNMYPNITTAPFSIGQTIEGREMWAIKISDNPNLDEDEPEIFFNGLVHAREPIGLEICLALIDTLLHGYGVSQQMTYFVNEREIFFLPIFNVDGYVYNETTNPTGGGMWRKNRRLNAGGSYGVDLNRNFGFNWGYNNVGSSPTPSSETYRGTGPFSEPETENVRQFCNDHYFAIALNLHSYSNLMLYSWSIPAAPWGYTPDNATFYSMSQTMNAWNGYEFGTAWEILYEVNGDANDWMYGEQVEKPKTLAWVFEVHPSSFWPYSQIQYLIDQNMQPCLYLIDQAANYVPIPVNLAYVSGVIDDQIGGNGNGGLDPGETAQFTPTLRNGGWVAGTGISATLVSPDPYITITTNSATYPNLDPRTSAPSNTPYTIVVSSTCPLEHTAQFGLIWTCNQGYSDTTTFSLVVGDPMYQPLGPDAYGYMAYDIYDQNGPEFNWIEVDPVVGGSGSLINFTQDDQTVQLTLPFTFRYYGQDYTQISVCTNGWIAMGVTTSTDYSNSAIPNVDGPPAMIAPFWEDLSPQQAGRVAYYYNAAQHYFVVEYDSVREYSPTTARETFEVVLYDPAHYPTLSGDGKILFQYNQTTDLSSNTVGIENQTQTIGLQCLYNGDLNNHMAAFQPGLAILFSTPTSAANLDITLTPVNPPIQIPATGGTFNFNASVANNGAAPATFDVWIMTQLPSGNWYGPVLGPVNLTLPSGVSITRTRTQTVPASAPAGTYVYRGYVGTYSSVKVDSSSFNFTKLTTGLGATFGEWSNSGESFASWFADDESALPDQVTLSQNYPNPFNPLTTIRYGLPQAAFVSLKIYDLQGREIAVLSDGNQPAGLHQVTWNAQDLASGVYLYVLRAGEYTAANKCLLIK